MNFLSFFKRKGGSKRVKSKSLKDGLADNPYIIKDLGYDRYLVDATLLPYADDDNRFCVLCDSDCIGEWWDKYDDEFVVTIESGGECPGTDHWSNFITEYNFEDLTRTAVSKLKLIEEGGVHGRL